MSAERDAVKEICLYVYCRSGGEADKRLDALCAAERDAGRREALGETYPVVSVEWSHPANDVEQGTTRLVVTGTVPHVGAGDTITYSRLAGGSAT